MLVLDTNVVSELMRPQPAVAVLSWLAPHAPRELRMTVITRAEIRYGIARLPRGQRRAELQARADALFEDIGELTLDFDSRAADVYGLLVADRERQGSPISVPDAQIAAITLTREGELVTRNVTDFVGCGLVVHDPWAGSSGMR